MASQLKRLVGEGTLNPLIAENLLKILKDPIPPSLQNPLSIPLYGIVGPQKAISFP